MRLNEDPDGPVIGQVNFSNIVRGAFQAAHMGYQIDAECEGRGLMTEALRLAIDFMFARFGLHRIMANYIRSEEHTSELQSLMRISYAVFCLKKKKKYTTFIHT